MPPPRSLKARALQWLAQREQSRVELRRKLLRQALVDNAGEAAKAAKAAEADTAAQAVQAVQAEEAGEVDAADIDTSAAAAEHVDALLDWLEAQGHLSPERFVESRVHARAPRFGNLRIRQELKQHRLALSPEAAHALTQSESERACAVRERKFGTAGAAGEVAPADRARQARFLAGRGFSPEAIARALRHTVAR